MGPSGGEGNTVEASVSALNLKSQKKQNKTKTWPNFPFGSFASHLSLQNQNKKIKSSLKLNASPTWDTPIQARAFVARGDGPEKAAGTRGTLSVCFGVASAQPETSCGLAALRGRGRKRAGGAGRARGGREGAPQGRGPPGGPRRTRTWIAERGRAGVLRPRAFAEGEAGRQRQSGPRGRRFPAVAFLPSARKSGLRTSPRLRPAPRPSGGSRTLSRVPCPWPAPASSSSGRAPPLPAARRASLSYKGGKMSRAAAARRGATSEAVASAAGPGSA